MQPKFIVIELQVVDEALHKANLTARDLSAVAVTIGPGLSLCLRGNFQQLFFHFFFLPAE